MEKDFQRWHKQKANIHNKKKDPPFFHEREIWWCSLGANVGREQDGRELNFARPVLVAKKFNNEIFWAIPLTKAKKHGEYYFSFPFLGQRSVAVLSQLRLVDSKRLIGKMGTMVEDDFLNIKKALSRLTN